MYENKTLWTVLQNHLRFRQIYAIDIGVVLHNTFIREYEKRISICLKKTKTAAIVYLLFNLLMWTTETERFG